MNTTLEELKQYEDLVVKTLSTGTIKHEDKKRIEEFLFKVTGNKVNCLGCNLNNILNILKAYKAKFDEAKSTTQETTVPVVTATLISDKTVSDTDADSTQQVGEAKKKAGRPKKQVEE